jgi:hypothetical protein
MADLRGCKPGLPDILIVYRGALIAIELKSECGRCTPAQLKVREALLAAGADWWEARSANAAMAALALSGVKFRMIAHSDGTIECWQPEPLEPWEVPRCDPAEPRLSRQNLRRSAGSVSGDGGSGSVPAKPHSGRQSRVETICKRPALTGTESYQRPCQWRDRRPDGARRDERQWHRLSVQGRFGHKDNAAQADRSSHLRPPAPTLFQPLRRLLDHA